MKDIFSGFLTYNNDPDKEEEVWGEESEDGDFHHDVQLAVDEEGAAGAGQVRGEVLQELDHDQQQRVSYRGSCICVEKLLLLCFAFCKL